MTLKDEDGALREEVSNVSVCELSLRGRVGILNSSIGLSN